jgi:hypothetical protein
MKTLGGWKLETHYSLAALAVLGIALYVWTRGAKGAAQDVGKAAGGAVVGAVDGVLSGAVLGASEAVGIPTPTVDECTSAIAEYRAAPWYKQAYLSFNVSAQCTAPDYLRFIATGKAPGEK